jgi:oligoendopeptidase F
LLFLFQDIKERKAQAENFAYCLTAQDVNDEKAMVIVEQMLSLDAAAESIRTGIEDLAISTDDEAWDRLMGYPDLGKTSFYWNELRRVARLKMDPKLERLATHLAVNGYHAWNLLYTKMAGDLRAEFTEDGQTKTLSMGQLSNKLSSPDRSVRKQAFEKLEQAWRSTEALASVELNSLAGFRLSLYKARGWDSPLFEPFLLARVKQETIEAMWNSVARGLGGISAYIEAKKRVLGIRDFCWYDQLAPVGKVEKTLTYEEACDFVIMHLSSFSEDLGGFARMAIDARWIEAEDRSGKAAGGFCAGMPVARQSRIFMTFSGSYNEMMTLAHELGHAYHSWVFRDRDYFARFYTMTLAETASTFNEMLVTDAAMGATQDESELLSLVDKKIQEHLAMFCNIRCRYLFETMFYEERRRGAVPKDRLNELMVEAQRTAFAGLLADDGYHPLFWASKMHFSETGVPFYNFPYTFGHLFAGGIYDRAKQEGPEFAERYQDLLADTGSMSCEDVAAKHLGVDLTTDKFWNDAVGRALKDVDLFIELARRAG